MQLPSAFPPPGAPDLPPPGPLFQVLSVLLALGLLAAVSLTRLIKTMLDGIGATDPLTFVAVASLLAAVALLAFSILGLLNVSRQRPAFIFGALLALVLALALFAPRGLIKPPAMGKLVYEKSK